MIADKSLYVASRNVILLLTFCFLGTQAAFASLSTIQDTISVGEADSYCSLVDSQPVGKLEGIENYCDNQSSSVVAFNLDANNCLNFSGLGIGSAQACIKVDYGSGNLDTIIYKVVVQEKSSEPTIVNVNIETGSTDLYCEFPIKKDGSQVEEITNTCEVTEKAATVFDIIGTCLEYHAQKSGTSQACLLLNYGGGVIDELIFNVHVYDPIPTLPEVVRDTLVINDQSIYCKLALGQKGEEVLGIQNYCEGAVPSNVDFDINYENFCLNYKAEAIGEGEACLAVRYGNNERDTILFKVVVRNPEPDFASVEIEQGEKVTVCADNIELFGNIESAAAICGSNGASDVTYNGSGVCFEVEGIKAGTDLACYEICDDNNICNTFEIEVNVLFKESLKLPVAKNDSVVATMGAPNEWMICANDTINSDTLTSIRVVPASEGGAGPFAGTVTFPEDGTCEMVYKPFPNACGYVDSIMYEICNGVGCDSAMVYVTIDCPSEEEGLSVLSGFSPNGDNINETLYIVGLEEYPNHTLTILNRYGAQIMETKSYKNDWDGKWDGQLLPDGTYYYVIETGEGSAKTGWFSIQR